MPDTNRTARTTGLLYLGLGIAGMLGFLLIRPRLHADDPATTLANLVEHGWLANAVVAFELLVVLTQALVAAWFYRLFRDVDPLNALGIAAFGLVNAVAILGSAAMLATATMVARDPVGDAAGTVAQDSVGDAAGTVQLLYLVSENLWGVAAIFFGLWLIPMGRCVLNSGWMPRVLGWILVAGGVGYVLSAFLRYLAPGAETLHQLLVIPATVGELWMIGQLLIRGVRHRAGKQTPVGRTPAEQTPAATVR